jgi:hypothetical protein
MNPGDYRVVSFDQGTRLNAGYQSRGQAIKDSNANPGDGALLGKAKSAASEFLAVHSTGGVCEALSLKWLKIKFKENSDDAKWAQVGRQKAAPRVGTLDRDKTFDRAFSRYAASKADQRFGLEDYYGLKAQFMMLPVEAGPVSMTAWVARTIAASKHGYFLHSICCPKIGDGSGYHAIAYYTSSGKAFNLSSHVYMFDPDYGEYKVPNSKFITWMPKFVSFFYGAGENHSRWLKTVNLGEKRATPAAG